jgi:hypothetical protein
VFCTVFLPRFIRQQGLAQDPLEFIDFDNELDLLSESASLHLNLLNNTKVTSQKTPSPNKKAETFVLSTF